MARMLGGHLEKSGAMPGGHTCPPPQGNGEFLVPGGREVDNASSEGSGNLTKPVRSGVKDGGANPEDTLRSAWKEPQESGHRVPIEEAHGGTSVRSHGSVIVTWETLGWGWGTRNCERGQAIPSFAPRKGPPVTP